MATKRPTRRRQPFVIEPLDWVAPDSERTDSQKHEKDSSRQYSESESKTS